MSEYGDMISAALSELPPLKDAAGLTYRRFLYQKLRDAHNAAIGGAPWTVEAEVALRRLPNHARPAGARRLRAAATLRCRSMKWSRSRTGR